MTADRMAATIVTLVEKHLGTGFDPVTDAILTSAVAQFLQEEVVSRQVPPAPDAFLEQQYEDRFYCPEE